MANRTSMKPEAKEIILYGDGELTPTSLGAAIYFEDRVLLCDFTEAGAHLLGFAHERKVEMVRLVDVLAENPFAKIKAPGCDRMRKLVVEEAKAKAAIELLAYLTRRFQLKRLNLNTVGC